MQLTQFVKSLFVQLLNVIDFFVIVAVSQILTLQRNYSYYDVDSIGQATGVYCFAYKVKILMILTYPNSSVIGK